MQAVFAWLVHYGYPALFSLLVLGIVGLPVPDETLLTFCGYLVFTGRLHLMPTLLAGFLGSIGGISISYILGARFGRLLLTRFGKYIGVTPWHILETERQFHRFGPILLTIGYFIPGLRHFTGIVAGLSGLRWPRFALFAYLGAALWVSTFVSLGYVVGERWQQTSEEFHRYVLIGLGVAAVILAAFWLIRYLRHRFLIQR